MPTEPPAWARDKMEWERDVIERVLQLVVAMGLLAIGSVFLSLSVILVQEPIGADIPAIGFLIVGLLLSSVGLANLDDGAHRRLWRRLGGVVSVTSGGDRG